MEEFEKLSQYLKQFDGMNKPHLNHKVMYNDFKNLTFIPSSNFGEYFNFGKAYGYKSYNMLVKNQSGEEKILIYKMYSDTVENLIYLL